MGSALVTSLIIISTFISGVILINYLAENMPYENLQTVVCVEELDFPVDLFLDMDQDGFPEHFYLFRGIKNEIKVIFEGDMIDNIPISSDKYEAFLIKDDVPKVYIKLSGERVKHIIFWKPGKNLLKVELYADNLKWIDSSTIEAIFQNKKCFYLFLNEPPFFTPKSIETINFLLKEYK